MCPSRGSIGTGYAGSSGSHGGPDPRQRAASLVFLPFRAHEIGVDAFFAFIFMSNWWFAAQATDYFAAGEALSPIQHYWSLSIEEHFYFVWPALIFLIGLVVARKAWSHRRRMGLAAVVMACVVVLSLGWALYQTATWPRGVLRHVRPRVGTGCRRIVGDSGRAAGPDTTGSEAVAVVGGARAHRCRPASHHRGIGRFPCSLGAAAGGRIGARHRRRCERRTNTRVSAQPGLRLRGEHLVLAVPGALARYRHTLRAHAPRRKLLSRGGRAHLRIGDRVLPLRREPLAAQRLAKAPLHHS